MHADPRPCLVSICLLEYNYFIITIYFDGLVVGSNHELINTAVRCHNLPSHYRIIILNTYAPVYIVY